MVGPLHATGLSGGGSRWQLPCSMPQACPVVVHAGSYRAGRLFLFDAVFRSALPSLAASLTLHGTLSCQPTHPPAAPVGFCYGSCPRRLPGSIVVAEEHEGGPVVGVGVRMVARGHHGQRVNRLERTPRATHFAALELGRQLLGFGTGQIT